MQFNGSAHPRSPIWHFVKWLHDLFTYGVFAVLGGALVLLVAVPALLSLMFGPMPPKSIQEKPIPPTTEELEAQRRRQQEQIEEQERQRKRIEERNK